MAGEVLDEGAAARAVCDGLRSGEIPQRPLLQDEAEFGRPVHLSAELPGSGGEIECDWGDGNPFSGCLPQGDPDTVIKIAKGLLSQEVDPREICKQAAEAGVSLIWADFDN